MSIINEKYLVLPEKPFYQKQNTSEQKGIGFHLLSIGGDVKAAGEKHNNTHLKNSFSSERIGA